MEDITILLGKPLAQVEHPTKSKSAVAFASIDIVLDVASKSLASMIVPWHFMLTLCDLANVFSTVNSVAIQLPTFKS